MKTVKEMSQLSGISVRTLHYYDKIALFKPSFVAENGYRYYNEEAELKLQEILLFRELEFPLKLIKEIMDSPTYDRKQAMAKQIRWLESKKSHLEEVIRHARAIQEGENMTSYRVYDKSEIEAFQREAKESWGRSSAYKEYEQRASSINQEQLMAGMASIFAGFAKLMSESVEDLAVQNQVKLLQDYISSHLYTCTKEILAGLGQMYTEDVRFKANIDKMGEPGTAEFASQAIAYYCKKG
ncbi:MerR family transcriptional regulator [Streptococcus catagoni]|uniref:MerR family transcriptional regulator n=1 Tax=Streptococcus catagoni TaxID=2654874 RepID=UPI00140DF2CB|nr:MerR family transcriptional regulator [Streptococcus catagoni]